MISLFLKTKEDTLKHGQEGEFSRKENNDSFIRRKSKSSNYGSIDNSNKWCKDTNNRQGKNEKSSRISIPVKTNLIQNNKICKATKLLRSLTMIAREVSKEHNKVSLVNRNTVNSIVTSKVTNSKLLRDRNPPRSTEMAIWMNLIEGLLLYQYNKFSNQKCYESINIYIYFFYIKDIN